MLSSTDSVNGSWTYAMNGLDQLSQACLAGCASGALGYSYDRYGNRWGASGAGTLAAPVLPGLSFDATNRVPGWSYDAAGNLLGDGTHTYQYDAEDRLLSVDNGTTASYAYGPEGRRVEETVGGVVKQFVYGEGGQNLIVLDGSGNILQDEVYAGSRHLATLDGGTTPEWELSDWLGTVRMATNSSGGTVDAYTSSYGADLNRMGAVSSDHFTDKYHDSATGFDYFGARYYNPGAGRFLTPDDGSAQDQGDPQSWNLYSYVLDNPVTFTDPNGHDCLYTSGQTDNSADVTVESGSCTESGGAFVKGTVDVSSLTLNNGQVGYTFANNQNGSGGAGVLQLPDLNQQREDFIFGMVASQAGPAVNAMATGLGSFAMVAAPEEIGAAFGTEAATTGATVEEILAGADHEGTSRSAIYSKPGGAAQAKRDFQSLAGHEETHGLVQIKTLPDGRRAVLRTNPGAWSSDGRPSLDIQPAGGGYKALSIHYN